MLRAERDISAPKTRLIQIKAGNFAPGMKAKDHKQQLGSGLLHCPKISAKWKTCVASLWI